MHKAKIFLPSNYHASNRTPRTSRLVPSPARAFGPRTSLRAVGEEIKPLKVILTKRFVLIKQNGNFKTK